MIMVVVTGLYIFVQTHRIVHLKFVIKILINYIPMKLILKIASRKRHKLESRC